MILTSFFKYINGIILKTYKYRYVIISYVSVNLRQKYRRSGLGFAWSLLSPLLQYGIIAYIFHATTRITMSNYLAFAFSAALVFSVCSNVLNLSSNILISNESFIKKINVPKLVYVLNSVLYEFSNFLLNFFALLLVGIVIGKVPLTVNLLFIPFVFILLLFFLCGIAILISVVAVFFRDFVFIIPVIAQVSLFITPIYYELSQAPDFIKMISKINPFFYFSELIRACVWTGGSFSPKILGGAFIFSMVAPVLGLIVLKKADNKIVFRL